MQFLDDDFKQRTVEELQRVPDQSAIESGRLEIERRVQERMRFERIGLVLVKIAFAERLVELTHEVVRKETMPVVDQEADSLLARAGKIENRKTGALFKR